MPKVSVIIPNYNHASFLEKRIQSILEQTYQDFEIIYLDDASTDNSNEVFAKFSDNPRIKSIYNQTNSGSPFKQWNKGIKSANGEYIWLAEADDYADPKLLEALVAILDNNPKVGLVYCQSWRVDEFGNITNTLEHWTDNLSTEHWHNNFVNSGLDECTKYLVFQNTIPNASAVLVRRKLYEEIGYADESMTFCGDWITWVKLLLISDLAFIAEPLNYFRFHNSSVSSKSISNGIYIYEKSQIINFIHQNVQIPIPTLEAVSEKVMDEWVSLIVRSPKNIPRGRYWKVYAAIRKFEPRLKFKLFNKIVAYYFTRIKQKVHQSLLSMQSFLQNREGY